jgi:hypothetical protein
MICHQRLCTTKCVPAGQDSANSIQKSSQSGPAHKIFPRSIPLTMVCRSFPRSYVFAKASPHRSLQTFQGISAPDHVHSELVNRKSEERPLCLLFNLVKMHVCFVYLKIFHGNRPFDSRNHHLLWILGKDYPSFKVASLISRPICIF